MCKRFFIVFIALISSVYFFSCRTLPSEKNQISRELTGNGIMTSKELAAYFCKKNSSASQKKMQEFASCYIKEAKMEGINSDVAFAQMCVETGYLNFGNLVVPEMHNYCGLGAMDKAHPGEWFKTEQQGIRAHIQHLHAYATTEEVSLKNPLIDPRYSWPHKTRYAETVFELAGTWAMDKEYGKKIDRILSEMQTFHK